MLLLSLCMQGGKDKERYMLSLIIGGNEYKVEYGFNSFCDTDLLERTGDLITLLSGADATSDKDVSEMGKIKDLFSITRELLYVGFEENNPVEDVKVVGKLLDVYRKEAPDGESRGVIDIFGMLSGELMNEGFFADLMNKLAEATAPNRETKRVLKKKN